jgi:hypothetical protein
MSQPSTPESNVESSTSNDINVGNQTIENLVDLTNEQEEERLATENRIYLESNRNFNTARNYLPIRRKFEVQDT